MATPIAAFTADNHLRPSTWVKHPSLAGDAYAAWFQICAFCAMYRLPLLQLGDLFDSTRPDSHSVSQYLEGVQQLQAANVPFFFIEGNHDLASPPWAKVSAWAQPAEGLFHIAGIPFYGLGYKSAATLSGELTRIPMETRVLLSHQAWKEIQGVGAVDAAFSALPRGMTLLTGDYHVCDVYHGFAQDGQPVTAYSPGSTALQALNEPAAKNFGILYDDLTVQWQPLVTRACHRVHLTTSDELDALIASIRTGQLQPPLVSIPCLQKAILAIRYSDHLPDAYARLTDAVGELFHLFLEPVRSKTDTVEVPANIVQGIGSLQTVAVSLLGLKVDQYTADATGLLQRLLDNPSDMLTAYTAAHAQYMARNTIQQGV